MKLGFRKVIINDSEGNPVSNGYQMKGIVKSLDTSWVENETTGKRYKRLTMVVDNPAKAGATLEVQSIIAEANLDHLPEGNVTVGQELLVTARPGKDKNGNGRTYFQTSHLSYTEIISDVDFFGAEMLDFAPAAQPKVNTPG